MIYLNDLYEVSINGVSLGIYLIYIEWNESGDEHVK